MIPRSVRLSEAPSYGLPIALYRADSKGAEAYAALARELPRATAARREPRHARTTATDAVASAAMAGDAVPSPARTRRDGVRS